MSDKKLLEELATIDHIKPISKGGKRYERDNCMIVCFPCNQRKADRYSR